MHKRSLIMSVYFLGICIVFSSYLLADALKPEEKIKPVQEEYNALLTEVQLADYLGISIDEMRKLAPTKPIDGNVISQSPIPYIQISGKNYFSKAAIDAWLLKNEAFFTQ